MEEEYLRTVTVLVTDDPPKSETRGASPGNPEEPAAGVSALSIKLCGEFSDMRTAHSTLQADEGTRIATTHTPREDLS